MVEITPFEETHDGADVIIRTCDSMNFYVHKSILSASSPFFSDMFSLEQPPPAAPDATNNTSGAIVHLPVIDVTEDSVTINTLLRLCYPDVSTNITSLVGISDIMEAATKYDMDDVLADIRRILVEMSPLEASRAYALACRFHFDDVAFEAAEAQRKASDWRNRERTHATTPATRGEYDSPWEESLPGSSFNEDMALLSAGTYYRFLRFVRSSLRTPPSLKPYEGPFETINQGLLPIKEIVQVMEPEQADVIIQSQGDSQSGLYANRTVISFASPYLASLITEQLELDENAPVKDVGGLPVVSLPGSTFTISLILQSIHPSLRYKFDIPAATLPIIPDSYTNSDKDLEDEFTNILSFIDASLKYSIPGSIAYGKRLLTHPRYLSKFPLRIFFIAAKSGWEDEARQTAIYCSRRTFICEQYVPEMEKVSASYYHALLKFQWEYQKAVCSCVKDVPHLAWTAWRKAGMLLVDKNAPFAGMFSPEVIYVYMVGSWIREDNTDNLEGLSAKLARLQNLSKDVERRLQAVSVRWFFFLSR